MGNSFIDIEKDKTLGIIELMTPTLYMNDDGSYWLHRTLIDVVN
ncbi:hypothetical protein [Alteromonas sp. MB-3u-76]|nr:hypothetical protein [Alteromonas sp. MB-3u-76]